MKHYNILLAGRIPTGLREGRTTIRSISCYRCGIRSQEFLWQFTFVTAQGKLITKLNIQSTFLPLVIQILTLFLYILGSCFVLSRWSYSTANVRWHSSPEHWRYVDRYERCSFQVRILIGIISMIGNYRKTEHSHVSGKILNYFYVIVIDTRVSFTFSFKICD